MRNLGDPPSDTIFLSTTVRANEITSTGKGNLPRAATTFPESATTTILFDADATTFSRVSAPPPPLIKFSLGSTSSAPSIVISISGCSSSVEIDITIDGADEVDSGIDFRMFVQRGQRNSIS